MNKDRYQAELDQLHTEHFIYPGHDAEDYFEDCPWCVEREAERQRENLATLERDPSDDWLEARRRAADMLRKSKKGE